jgi:dTDP-4-dehydrorhamnose reductase
VTIHVVGAGGMLGRDVVRAAGGDAVGFTRAELDVTDAAAVREALTGAIVVNCAAYTNVDGAESEPEAARLVNSDGARNVAEAAERVLYVSTDYVFDGRKGSPYVESDPTGPLQEYGRSKLAGEHATAEANPNHLVVRSSWLFGAGGKNFVETMLALARERDELRVVRDQVGCPTFTGHLAEALMELAGSEERGVVHVAGGGSCSWFEFARKIFERAGVDVQVDPCTTEELPRPAARPANSVLASERGAPVLPAWQEGLDAYLGVRA